MQNTGFNPDECNNWINKIMSGTSIYEGGSNPRDPIDQNF